MTRWAAWGEWRRPVRPFTLTIAVLLAVAGGFLATGCCGGGDAMTQRSSKAALVGRWSRVGDMEGDRVYPDHVEFRDDGSYVCRQEPGNDVFTWWDAGDYTVLSASEIEISTANDARQIYRYRISDDTVTFFDENDRPLKYRRETE